MFSAVLSANEDGLHPPVRRASRVQPTLTLFAIQDGRDARSEGLSMDVTVSLRATLQVTNSRNCSHYRTWQPVLFSCRRGHDE